jgi:hypothetical protein
MIECRRNKLWRVFGAGAWALTIVLWLVLWFFNPYTSAGGTITIPGMVMILVAIFGVFASLKGSWLGQLLASLASIFPIGLYLLGSPGIFAFIGILNMLSIVPTGNFLLFRRATEKSVSAKSR